MVSMVLLPLGCSSSNWCGWYLCVVGGVLFLQSVQGALMLLGMVVQQLGAGMGGGGAQNVP